MRKYLLINTIISLLIFFLNFQVYSTEIEIKGNKFSDENVILSIIGDVSELDNSSKSNFILKKLNNSGLFKSVEVINQNNKLIITILEYPSINKIFYNNNERIKDDEINNIAEQLEIFTLSDKNINLFIDELKQIYQSFGYNNIQIDYKSDLSANNSADLFLNFNEGKITKIKKISIIGNNTFDKSLILSKVKSKTKKITNIFANNNFKLYQINNDLIRINNFYKTQGYKDINTKFTVEYFPNYKVDIKFIIDECQKYFFSNLNLDNQLNDNNLLNDKLNNFLLKNKSINSQHYNSDKIDDLEFEISEILENSGEQFFEIKVLEKINNYQADILFQILKTKTKYINQINISGNTRTFDYVIRRELNIYEGDSINNSKFKKINKQLNRLPIFNNVNLETVDINNELQDLNIEVEETQTGSFNVGLSLGTLDGASFVSGLKERNINGTGRSLEFLVNTSQDNTAFTLSTTEKFFLNNKVNHKYAINYKENNFSKSKSYKLNTFTTDTSFKYLFSDNVYHTFGVGYSLKDYIITNSSTVSDNIAKSSGENISFNFTNELTLNTLNSFLRPTKGNYLSFANYIETPSSSSNGYIKNIITGKKFIEKNDNIYSIQSRVGNIFSLNDIEILSDNKFSLGGKWLRGFDNFGAGPRNSRTAYVGGNNLLVTKFDYSRPINLNEQNPIYFNLFNDYGIVWGNKNSINFTNDDLRASYGFGFNYYSPIGPMGFTWGFPLIDEDYDIKRMFMFTIGNLN